MKKLTSSLLILLLLICNCFGTAYADSENLYISNNATTPQVLNGYVSIPNTENKMISFSVQNEGCIGMHLPQDARLSKVLKGKNGVVFASALEDVKYAVEATEEKSEEGICEYGVRTTIIIDGASAPNEYKFNFDLPDDYHIVSYDEFGYNENDGIAYVIVDKDNYEQAYIKKPWATDADGNDIMTEYALCGNTLTQHIFFNSSSSFPIVADPWYGTGTKTENYGEPFSQGFTGYPGNQGSRGTRFTNGGYLSYSRGNNVTVTASISLGAGFGAATVSAQLGVVGDTGASVIQSFPVPNVDGWYKLKITERYTMQMYSLYRRWKDPDTGSVTWREYSRGVNKLDFEGIEGIVERT